MAQGRETGPGPEGYPAGGDISGATRKPEDERRPGERLPGEPVPGERLSGEPGAGEPLSAADPRDTRRPDDRAGRLPGTTGPGREGLTADDRSPAGAAEPRAGTAAPGTEGLTADPRVEQATGTGRAGSAGEETQGARSAGSDMPGGGGSTGARGEGSAATAGPGREDVAAGGRMPDNGLGAPSPGELTGREAATTEGRGTDTWPAAPGGAGRGAEGTGSPLLPHEEAERWEALLRKTAAGFVDEPRAAVEEADRELEEIAARFSEAVTRRRRTLRMSWQDTEGGGPGRETDTEQLRLALRDYRELAGRLLHL
ncbi:hypothetical protein [Streptomyces sp. NPDC007905]|uniref:hypothetical protein n=1 Tax=Streptomyces sp. NPDC007905 TaxID=3364788 RepID=UPI0036E8A263